MMGLCVYGGDWLMHSLRFCLQRGCKGKASEQLREPRAGLWLMKSSGALVDAEVPWRSEKAGDLVFYSRHMGDK